jgi:dTDP-4-dehydrorhamnose reductase
MTTKSRVLLIGADGQLGSDLMRVLKNSVPLTHKDLDICDTEKVRQAVEKHKPDIVINTSAFHKVDLCEDEVEKSFQVNAYALRELAHICRDRDMALVQISTDYVFDGRKKSPYTENDSPNPLGVYGVSKLAGELFIKNTLERYFIIRTCGLYGMGDPGRTRNNFVELMIRLGSAGKPIKVVNDQILTPTYTLELAEHIKKLIDTDEYGIFHITNNGECSWFEFAGEIFRLTGLDPDLSPTTSKEFGARAKRPAYSVLENASLKRIGLDNMSPWQEALRRYLEQRGLVKP